MCIHPHYMHVMYWEYMPNLVGIFISGTYVAIEVAVFCSLAYICKNVEFMYLYSMLAVYAIFGMW